MSNIAERVISSWNLSAPKPIIEGDPGRSKHEIKGFSCGESAVMRANLEPISVDAPDSASLVSRALAAFGTSQPWTAIYS